MSRLLPPRRSATLAAGVVVLAGAALTLVGPASAVPSAGATTASAGPTPPGPALTITRSATSLRSSTASAESPATVVRRVSPTGNDAASGSVLAPWRTLARASRDPLPAGALLVLDRGAAYQGTLSVSGSGTAARPIRIAPIGSGAAPVIENGECLQLHGSYVDVSGLLVRNCAWAGVSVQGAHQTVHGMRVTGNVAGVHVMPSATDARIVGNDIYDNRRLSPGKDGPNDDSGVNGVAVQGTRTVITGNRISGHHAPSPDYGIEGSAVEVYGARDTTISGNSSIDNSTFVELGDASTNATRIIRNTVTSVVPNGYFVVTRGAADSFGPVRGTVVNHNSVAMNGDGDGGLVCYAGCSPAIMSASDNIIVARRSPTWTDGSGMGGRNNILVNDSDPSTARRLFVDRRRDLRLVAASSAVDTAGVCRPVLIDQVPSPSLGASSRTCRDGNGDRRSGLDIGALER
ncbi:hypothetical protein GCM10011519_03840 [Marmoricola endophyticus]|uniref:Right handed beta helix domain-containing protein n=1 Tax=Marmoricola endophyticus TaxID=2040280 RepID=A0A917B9Y3_9ACTN|nr:right-handed parallel beta-helix repeat-containing protein [Marmoricola endophyticus]GGF33642.1 hypothetical protein GCM10011519_03840 [Marmoricola endophyticus]